MHYLSAPDGNDRSCDDDLSVSGGRLLCPVSHVYGNFVPAILKLENINEIIDIDDDEAYKGCNILAKEEGIFAGISSGAALSAALKLDSNKFKNKNIVIILPDNGERYLSVEGLYE